MTTLEQLKEIVNEYKGEELSVSPESTFDDLGFDSLDKVELMMQVDEKFGIELGDDIVVNTVADLIAKIDELKK